MQPGIYLVHKPVGPTSFSVVAGFQEELRRAFVRPGKVPLCHGGALDPFAEGLLLVLAGPATRLMELLHPIPKVYEAELAWGAETDNGDGLGQVVRTGDASALTPRALEEALQEHLGWQDQVPPAHSNKRVGGERAYQRAHRGEEVALPPGRVYLHEARFLSHDLPRSSRLWLTCRGGYYVRALARDLGRALGCGAHLTALRRTAIGPWMDPGPDNRVLAQGEALLPWCPSRELTAREAKEVSARRPVPTGRIHAPPWKLPEGFPSLDPKVRGLQEGKLLALLRPEGAWLRVEIAMGRPI